MHLWTGPCFCVSIGIYHATVYAFCDNRIIRPLRSNVWLLDRLGFIQHAELGAFAWQDAYLCVDMSVKMGEISSYPVYHAHFPSLPWMPGDGITT